MVPNNAQPRRRGFSLIELVIVVVIIGIIAAIAIPRMSRGSAGAADSALSASLTTLRQAIDLYQAEHGTYPTVGGFANQLTLFSNADGTLTAAAKDTGTNQIIYGPYLRKVPALPVGAVTEKGKNSVGATAGTAIAWIYDAATGEIKPNATGNDSAGNPYSGY